MSKRWALVARARPNLSPRELVAAVGVDESIQARRSQLAERVSTLTQGGPGFTTASGRGALLALLASAGRPRVVIPAYTCNAVAEAAGLAGLRTDLVDVSDGYNWSPGDIADAAGPDAVVVATHQYGIPCQIDQVAAAAHAAGALVIEDCAGGLGGSSDGSPLGSVGDAAVFSFDMSKLVHVPIKGGAATVRDPDWRDRATRWMAANTAPMPARAKANQLAQAALLSSLGPRSYRLLHTAMLSARGIATTESDELSERPNRFYDTEPAEWQAGIALRQLERIDEIAAGARGLYGRYREGLAGCRSIELPPADDRGEWAPIRFPVLVDGDKLRFYERLLERGVDCAFSFTHLAPHSQPSRAQALADAVLCLPFYPGLSAADAARVIAAVVDVNGGWRR